MTLERGRADFHTAVIFAYGKDTYGTIRSKNVYVQGGVNDAIRNGTQVRLGSQG